MNRYVQRFFQIAILLGLICYLIFKWANGKLSYYINLRFSPLIGLAILGLAIMIASGVWGLHGALKSFSKHTESLPVQNSTTNVVSGFAIVILVVPLLLGVLVPERPLSSKALDTRGMSLSAPGSLSPKAIQNFNSSPEDRTVLDWIKIFNYEPDLTPYLDQTANVTGFVYHDPRLPTGQFMVGRFAIVCCVADAFAIGMAVEWPDSANLQDNTWVDVKGAVNEVTVDGKKIPLIQAVSVTPVSAPSEPYLYP
jgi:uncharacterized repeat protein (TIGR03943 family)